MKKYDFSGISDERLKESVVHHVEGGDLAYTFCYSISCRNCPFSTNETSCYKKPDKIRKEFKEELERRNKLKDNERPELKAGMILDLEYRGKSMGLFLYINENWTIKLDDEYGYERDLNEIRITKIYTRKPASYRSITDGLNLIWQATPTQQQKIEELEETVKEATKVIKKATKQIEELKNSVNS